VQLLQTLTQSPQNRLSKAVNIADLRICAKKRSHKMVFDYLDSGSDDEITLRRAKDAYSELEMHYHCLAGLEPPLDLSTTIFGEYVSVPFFGCPTAGNRMFHTDGGCSKGFTIPWHNVCAFVTCHYSHPRNKRNVSLAFDDLILSDKILT